MNLSAGTHRHPRYKIARSSDMFSRDLPTSQARSDLGNRRVQRHYLSFWQL